MLLAPEDQPRRGVRAAARPAGVQVTSALAPAPVSGDIELVERLVANLLDNAMRLRWWRPTRSSFSPNRSGD
jgi:signal transduction histidine kinase